MFVPDCMKSDVKLLLEKREQIGVSCIETHGFDESLDRRKEGDRNGCVMSMMICEWMIENRNPYESPRTLEYVENKEQ